MSEAPTDTQLCVRAPDRLTSRFEGLGDLCEFGVVQRFCGIEPLGLLRFAAMPHDKLLALLATRFSALDDPDEISLVIGPNEGEWMGVIARYGIVYHTGQNSRDTTHKALLPKERRRVARLKRKLLEQLDAPEKVFLRRGPHMPGCGYRRALRGVAGLRAASAALGSTTPTILPRSARSVPYRTASCAPATGISGRMQRSPRLP